jgi:glycosyltransferase involved in cell wall biosynthesis
MKETKKQMVSIVIPGYNEEAMILPNLTIICNYMKGLEGKFDWEIIFVNDGSKDQTGKLADDFACKNPKVRVCHHIVNLNLGNALKTGFSNAKGDYTVVLDLDLSYGQEHIEKIVDTLITTQAHVVIASPYMKGGKVTAVPFLRVFLSKCVNRFMRLASQEKYHTYTGMVRGYRTDFIQNLNLKTKDYEINPEILYKSMILRARIVEVPAHLDWTEQNKLKGKRTSNMRILKSIFSGLMSGFIFRPYIFFLGAATILFLISIYVIVWIFINTLNVYPEIIATSDYFDDRFSRAVGFVFQKRSHSFFVGGFTLMVSFIFFAIGFLSLQSKRYFEELFHLDTYIRRKVSKK